MNKIKIESIINARLKLQSTQKALFEEFGLHISGLNYLKTVAESFHQWDKDKQKQFAFIIGGRTNLKYTFNYLNNLNTLTLA